MPGADMGEYFAELEVSFNGSETPTLIIGKLISNNSTPPFPSLTRGSPRRVSRMRHPPPTTPWGGRPVRHQNLDRRGVGYR